MDDFYFGIVCGVAGFAALWVWAMTTVRYFANKEQEQRRIKCESERAMTAVLKLLTKDDLTKSDVVSGLSSTCINAPPDDVDLQLFLEAQREILIQRHARLEC